MRWYHYLALFLAGAFLANSVPHFVQGISGPASMSTWLRLASHSAGLPGLRPGETS